VVSAQSRNATQLELHLETFDGPLELLLMLIEQHRLPITQVSLAQVADQYLAHVHAQPSLDAELLADFLVIGGKLLLLKSRALLLTEEPDQEAEEVASDLAERLATYRVFRAAAEVLRDLEQRGERLYPTQREPALATGCGVGSWRNLGLPRSNCLVLRVRVLTSAAHASSTRCAGHRRCRSDPWQVIRLTRSSRRFSPYWSCSVAR
jgi:hypothetical protein